MASKISTSPKLLNGFGEVFDYKNTELEKQAIEQIHQKKLNLERDLQRLRVQKKLEKNNFYKFKNTLQITFKSQKAELRFRFRSEKKRLQEIIKNCQKLIPFETFIAKKINLLSKEIKKHVAKAIRSLKLIQYSDEDDHELELKTQTYKDQALKVEDQLVIYKTFLTDLLSQQPHFNDVNLTAETLEQISHNLLAKETNPELHTYIENELKKLLRAYKSQAYFKYKDQVPSLQGELQQLIANYKTDLKACKANHKQALQDEKTKIKTNFNTSVGTAKTTFAEQRLKLRDNEVNQEAKLLDQEIKQRLKDRQTTIKAIKKTAKTSYKTNLKNYKQEHPHKIKFWAPKTTAINEAQNTFNWRLAFNRQLFSLNQWQYRYGLKELKVAYWNDLGNQLSQWSYDGDFYLKNADALQKAITLKQANDAQFVTTIAANTNLAQTSSKIDPIDKAAFEEKAAQLKQQYLEELATLKTQVQEKAITKAAYKVAKMKLTIFLEEDLKAIKMNLPSSKAQYDARDALISYYRQDQMIKKNFLQDKNKISKETPVEYKRNNAFWMALLTFFVPGVDSLILKNWKKAAFFLTLTFFAWAFFIPYAFGAYNIKGQGILGLIRLSWPTGISSPVYGQLWTDSRYALVEGVIGLLLLVLSLAYLIISAYQCFKITRAMEKGIRANTWVETKKTLRAAGFPFAISIPGLIMIAFIVIMPIIVSFLLAFTNIGTQHNPSGGEQSSWVGFEQFWRLFTNQEFFRPFGNVLWWNIVWAIGTTGLVLVLGTVMALAVENKNIKGKVFWRTIFILPWAIPAFLSILFFKIIFGDSSSSLINSLLINAGMKPINWQSDAIMSRLILILIQGWLGHSYIVLLVSGNMKAISNDIYEAGRIDGAKPFKQFMKMTLPIILIQIAPLLISQFTFNFNNFSIIWLFNEGGAKIDPTYIYDVGNNDIILSWIFKISFGGQATSVVSNQALGSALVIVMSIFVVGASGIGFARSKAFRKGEDI